MAKLTKEQIVQLVKWRERGWSCASIARRLGVSTGAVNYQCLQHGAISPNQKGKTTYNGPAQFVGKDGRTFRRFTDEEDARLRALASQTSRIDEIVAAMGRARTSVRMRLLLLGAHEDIAA